MAEHIVLVALIALAGCTQTAPRVERITIREPVHVEVPVPTACAIEPELLAPLDVELPKFIETCAPASSGLTPDNETRLQELLAAQDQRIRGWRVWAETCGTGATEPPDH